MSLKTHHLALPVAIAAMLALPVASQASPVDFGSTLTSQPTASNTCDLSGNNMNVGPCTRVGVAYIDGGAVNGAVTAPIDGTITAFRVRSGVAGSITFRLVRFSGINVHTGQGTATGDGTGPTVNVAGTTNIESFPANLPVHAGDYLAIDSSSTGTLTCDQGSNEQYLFNPPLADNGPLTAHTDIDDCTLLVQAEITPTPPSTGGGGGGTGTGPGTGSNNGTPPPTLVTAHSNVFGLPGPKACTDRRRFRFPIHQDRGSNGAVVSATIYVNGHEVKTVHGSDLSSVSLTRLPKRHFRVTVKALTTKNFLIVSTRTYDGCVKGKRHDTKHRR
jgi:hypothetical protein